MQRLRLVACAVAALMPSAAALASSPLAEVQVTAQAVHVQPWVDGGQALFSLSGPRGFRFERAFPVAEALSVPLVDEHQALLGDGDYTYEVRLLDAAPAADKRASAAPVPQRVQSGSFRITGGVVVRPEQRRAEAEARATRVEAPNDFVLTENLIGRAACLSSDANCANGEPLGIIDVKMKGNIPLIRWERTGAGDKTWDIDVDLGGFRIAQVTDGRAPLLIADAAPTNSVRVDGFGRVGLGTSLPSENLHIVDSSDSSLRLQVGGQAWDIFTGSGSTALRVFNATGGGIPLVIDPNGDVGVGPSLPTRSLHVRRSNGTTRLFVEEASATAAERVLFHLKNKGKTRFLIENTESGDLWTFDNTGSAGFAISKVGTGVNELLVDGAGNLTIQGVLTQLSDRNAKRDFEAVDAAALLERVAALPVSSWTYAADAKGSRHIGPTAQDFAAAFALGADDRHVAPSDVAGVSLAAVQALKRSQDALRDELARKDAYVRALEERLARLEARWPTTPAE